MHTIRPRRVAALLAVLALLLTALPAAAAPERPVASEPGVRVPLVHALAAWFAALWPGSDPPAAPQSVWEELGPDADPGGAPQSVWEELGSGLDPGGAPQPESDVPAATPQLGPVADPFV